MRYFLGFDLKAKHKLAIEHWRDLALPKFRAPIASKNFHITSVFLGQMDASQRDRLIQLIDAMTLPAFSLTLDQLGYFSKPKVLWLGSSEPVESATHINKELIEVANQVGLGIPKSRYIPHVSLVRKVANNPPAALMDCKLECYFSQLHLFESVSGDKGLSYPIRYSWDLHPLPR